MDISRWTWVLSSLQVETIFPLFTGDISGGVGRSLLREEGQFPRIGNAGGKNKLKLIRAEAINKIKELH